MSVSAAREGLSIQEPVVFWIKENHGKNITSEISRSRMDWSVRAEIASSRLSSPSVRSASDAWESAAAAVAAGRREERLGEADTHRLSRSAVPRCRHHCRFGRRYLSVFTFLIIALLPWCVIEIVDHVERQMSWRLVSIFSNIVVWRKPCFYPQWQLV